MERARLAATLGAVSLAAACSGHDVSCSSRQTTDLVSKVLRDQYLNDIWAQLAIDAERSTFKILDVRTRGSDGRRKHCAASLDFGTVRLTSLGETARDQLTARLGTVTYRVEVTDDGSRIVVEVDP